MTLIDGKAISEQVKQEIAAEVAEIVARGGKRPHLAAILVGHDGGSETYVAAKVKACEVCGFKSSLIRYEADVTEEELLAKVRVFCPAVPVILITAWGSINLAVQGIRAGAFDFITKPWNNLALLKTIETAIQLRDSEEKSPDPKNGKTERTDRFDKIIGRSPLLQQVLNTISRISQTNRPCADHRRKRHRQGTDCRSKSMKTATGRANRLSKSIWEAFLSRCSKVKCSGINRCLHRRRHDRTGRFELADKGRSFWMRSGNWIWFAR